MSQNDFTIANQGFPAFRADLNGALQALASNSAGTSAPTTTFAYQYWYDSTNNLLKIRNADDDAWITLFTFDQTNDTVTVSGEKLVDDTSPQLGGNLDTNSFDINFADNDKAIFGAGSDLQIWHDGSNSFVKDAGTGSLRILGDELKFLNAGDNQLKLTADTNGAVKLYYSGTEKVATTSTGVTITGTAVATTDTDTTNTGTVTLDFAANQNFVLTLTGNVTLANPTTEQVGQSGFIVFIQDATGGRTVSLGTDYETAGAAGITLSSTASTTDIVPYVVAASGRILLGAPQLAFA